MADRDFRNLLHAFARRVITWDEFLEMNVPAGVSPMRTWTVIAALSKAIGLRLPVTDPDGTAYWYARTYELTDAVQEVSAACRSGSRIHRAITGSGGQHFMLRMRLDETIASAQLDGLDVDERTLPRLRTAQGPKNASERLLVNAGRIAERIPELVDTPFSPELFKDFRDQLLEGVAEDELPGQPAKRGLQTYSAGLGSTSRFAEQQLSALSAYANHEAGDEFDHPVLRAYMLAFALHAYRPLGAVGAVVGRLAAQLYSLKHDLPVLALLPVSRLKIEWEDGTIGPPLVACDRDTFEALRRRKPDDLTVLQTVTAQLMRHAVHRIEGYIEKWEQRDRRMRELLRADPGVNQRQRSIISRALRSAEAEFTIRYHEHNHGIAYATARRDFTELAEKGYLVMAQRGKTFVFTASPNLRSLLEGEALTA